MTKILYIYEDEEPTNIEALVLVKRLCSLYDCSYRKCLIKDIKAEYIDECDIILSVRSTSLLEYYLSEYAKKLGKFWVLLLDDDFLSLGKTYGKDNLGYNISRQTYLTKLLKNVDCIWAVNKLLAEKYTSLAGISRYFLTNTVVDPEKFTKPQKVEDKIKIVFYVNDGTTTMFDRILRPVLEKSYENKIFDNVSIYFLGVKPDVSEFDERIEFHFVPHMSFECFLVYLSEQNFSIGLAPLDNEGFSKYKYFNKYIEYTRAGIAGVYSDCPLYRQVVKSGYNGILCENSPEAWETAISSIIENEEMRINLILNAQSFASENFTSSRNISAMLDSCPEFITYKSPDAKARFFIIYMIKLKYWFFRVKGWGTTFILYIKAGKTKELLKKILEAFHK